MPPSDSLWRGQQLAETLRALAERFRPNRVAPAPIGADDLRVQLTMPCWTIQRSTDREYLYKRFSRLATQFALRFAAADWPDYLLTWNMRYLRTRATQAIGLPPPADLLTPPIGDRGRPDVVFSYGEFPRGYLDTPVLWEHTFAPQLVHDTVSFTQAWRERASDIVDRAARVVTATDVSAEWFARLFPRAAGKVRSIPYYLPELRLIELDALAHKQTDCGRVRLLFVGKQARRKGLLQLVAAWEQLDAGTRAQLEVSVISAMLDGPIALPSEWRWTAHVPDVQLAMRRAHALLHPALAEAFGLVLVEAMAAGCVPITTTAPLQRSIVGDEAGLFVDPRDASALAEQLRTLVRDPTRAMLQAKMGAARARFVARYDPERVARQQADLLFEAAGRPGPAPLRAEGGLA